MHRKKSNKELFFLGIAFSVISLLLQFIYFGIDEGKFIFEFYFPIELYSFDIFFFSFFEFLPHALFLVFALLFGRKKPFLLAVPFAVTSITYVLPGLRYLDSDYIVFILFYIIFTLLIFLTFKNIIKTRLPLILLSFLVMVIVFIPFIWSEQSGIGQHYIISDFLRIIFLFAACGVFAISLPINENKEKFDLKNNDITDDNPSNAYNSENFEKKDIALCVVFSIITFGIYGIFWLYLIIKNIKILNKEQPEAIGELLLNMFIPFYSIYWVYTRGKKMFFAAKNRGLNIVDNSVIYLILSLFGLSIVVYCLMQNDFNSIDKTTLYQNAGSVSSENQVRTVQITQVANNKTESFESLQKLHLLKEQGIITSEEYENKKSEILSRI